MFWHVRLGLSKEFLPFSRNDAELKDKMGQIHFTFLSLDSLPQIKIQRCSIKKCRIGCPSSIEMQVKQLGMAL